MPSFEDGDAELAILVLKSEISALVGMVRDIAEQTGFLDPDGLSTLERFMKQRRSELEKEFRRLEEGDPALASQLHERYIGANHGSSE